MKTKKSLHRFLSILSTLVVPVFAWMLTQMGGGTLSIKNFGLTVSSQNVSDSLVNIFTVHATTNNRHTMKLKDMAVGQVVTLGNRKFVRVSENTFQGVELAGITCGTHSSLSLTDINTCVCDEGWFADTAGSTSHHAEGGSCNVKNMQDFTAADCASYATPTGTNYTTVGTLIDSRDNKTYQIRKFSDGKCWMANNLAYGNVSSGADFKTYSYDNKTASGVLGSGLYGVAASPGSGYEGYLYDWQAVMQRADAYYGLAYAGPEGVQGICPTGWHVPTGDSSGELQALSDATGNNAAFFAGGNFCASGTSCLAGYIYGNSGSLYDQGSVLFVWSSTPYSTTDTNYSYDLYAFSGFVSPADVSRYRGFSVRCVKDPCDSGYSWDENTNSCQPRYMQDFTASECASYTTPTGTNYTDVGTFIDKRDNKTYQIRKFSDGHCWMANNLAYGNVSSGADFKTYSYTNKTASGVLGSGLYGVAASPGTGYEGYLYDWQAVMQRSDAYYGLAYSGPTPVQGICPTGWHVPTGGSSGELQALSDTTGTNGAFFAGGNFCSSGSSCLAGDIVGDNGSLYSQGSELGVWSSTPSSATNTNYSYYLYADSGEVSPADKYGRYIGFSVRCVKDAGDCPAGQVWDTTAGACRNKTMQEFTHEDCSSYATPTGTNYTNVGTLKDERDGTEYTIRKFADGKCWMANNLAYGNVSDASIYAANSEKSASGVLGSGLYGVAMSPGSGYEGYLYNWQAAMQRSDAYYDLAYTGPAGVQGICPTGWHVSTGGDSGELKALSDATGTNAAFFAGGNFCASGNSCLAGGIYGSSGSLDTQGSYLLVWSSTPYSTTSTRSSYSLHALSGGVDPASSDGRYRGFSVRCVKDGTQCPAGTYANSKGDTMTYDGNCSYQKYCTGANTVTVYATSAPTSCSCADGYYGNANGTSATTTLNGSCVAYATPDYSSQFAGRTMQSFTAEECDALPTPPADEYVKVGTFSDSRNNQTYTIRKFSDGKCWMAQNLAYGNVSSAADFKTYAYTNKTASGVLGSGLYGVAASPGGSYEGYLYDWQAVMQRSDAYYGLAYSGPSPVQGICPTGWHVPTGGPSGELKVLSDATGTNAAFFAGGNFCASGTSCLAGLIYGNYGLLSDQGRDLGVWSSTPYSTTSTDNSYRLFAYSGLVNPANVYSRYYGFSVRCVKDRCDPGYVWDGNAGRCLPRYMQDFTSADCDSYATPTGTDYTDVGIFIDKRDNKTYEIRKFADGKCWMANNLAYGNVSSAADFKTYSYDNPNTIDVLGDGLYGVAASPGEGYEGYLYDWQAAVQDANAYRGQAVSLNEPVQGICPTGWHIPTSGDSGEFKALFDAIGIGIRDTDFFKGGNFCAAGSSCITGYLEGSVGRIYRLGSEVNIWSSTPTSNNTNVYNLSADSFVLTDRSSYLARYYGTSVRCVKDGTTCPAGTYADNKGYTMTYDGNCSYQKYCTGANTVAVYATSAPSSCTCVDGYYGNTNGTSTTTTLNGACVTYTTPDYSSQYTERTMQSFTPEECRALPTPPADEYVKVGTFTDSRNNQTYEIRKFSDGKCWMANNLAYGNVSSSADFKTYSYDNPNTIDVLGDGLYGVAASPGEGYEGYLYDWQAAMQRSDAYYGLAYTGPEGVQGICPSGWHVPTGAYFHYPTEKYYGELWTLSDTIGVRRVAFFKGGNFCAAGSSCAAGRINGNNGSLYGQGSNLYVWSSTPDDATSTDESRDLSVYGSYVYEGESRDRYYGFSVRCVKDGTVCPAGTYVNDRGDTVTYDGSCSYQKYCTGANTVTVYATSAPSSCACVDGYYSDAEGTSTVTTLNGTCVAYATPDYSSQFAGRTMQSFTAEECNALPTPPADEYVKVGTFSDSRNNQTYTIRKFADGKCWMANNLAYGNVSSAADFKTYSYTNKTASDILGTGLYGVAVSPGEGYEGYLYNWQATMQRADTRYGLAYAGPEGVQGICPTGWHVPTGGDSGELKALALAAGANRTYETSTAFFSGGNFCTGGSACLAGNISGSSGSLYSQGSSLHVWSSTPLSSGEVGATYYFYADSDNLYPTRYDYRYQGFSVRCVKDPCDSGYSWDENTNSCQPRYMQDFTASECASYATPTGTNYTTVGTLIDSRDNKTYEIRKFSDGKCWMANNLAYGNVSSAADFKTYSYDNKTASGVLGSGLYGVAASLGSGYEGYLYDWQAVMQRSDAYYGLAYSGPTGVQGICPAGWHVPTGGSSGELRALSDATGTNVAFFSGGNFCASGKSCLAGVIYGDDGSLYDQGSDLVVWSSTPYSTTHTNSSYLLYANSGEVYPADTNGRYVGFSVRCVKDGTQCPAGTYANSKGDTMTYDGTCNYSSCPDGKYADDKGGTIAYNGVCNYNKYCSGNNVVGPVYATSAPVSCSCAKNYYGNANGTTATTTATGSCVALTAPLDYSSQFANRAMQSFTTAECNALPTPATTAYVQVGSFKDTRNNQSYVIRKFSDGKCWMANNLAYGNVSSAADFKTYSYDNKTASGVLGSGLYGVAASPGTGYEGYLYNWQAVMQRSDAYYGLAYTGPEGVQGICPTGWHVPTGGSSGEFEALSDATGTNAAFFAGGNFCASGDSCVTGRIYGDYGQLYGQGSDLFVWSSTPYSATNTSYSYYLYANSGGVYPANYDYRYDGFSVRCVKD